MIRKNPRGDLPAGFHVPSTTGINACTDLACIPKVTASTAKFSGKHGARQQGAGGCLQETSAVFRVDCDL